ncbi:MAG: Txe/YoeB family addiction module toxin [Treponemataceae bacterium]|nr:Txe/YoeB family addiction module toxin [Treponemataceae bacterium]
MYRIVFEKQALKDIQNLKSSKLDGKAKELIEVVRINPFQNPPPYEALVGNLSGLFSRRLNIQHRFVYQVYSEKIIEENTEYDGTVKIIRMWSHYDNVK